MQLLPQVTEYLDARLAEIEQISEERKSELAALADFVSQKTTAGTPVRLTFVCTHNSRRSHLSQIWAAVGAAKFDVSTVETFSGGTESTAFNPRAVAALKRAGLAIESDDREDNPRYHVTFGCEADPLICFSKEIAADPNPQSDFCAVMTCNHADQSCPHVSGAAYRLAIPYEDPKIADGTDQESAKYDERCAQICREMLYVFSLVR